MRHFPKFTRRAALMAVVVLFAASSVLAQSGGGFDLSWFTVDSGGGESSGGGFTVNGTIGQPDAGQVSGGDFTVSGGFWDASTSPTPTVQFGAASYRVNEANGQATITVTLNIPLGITATVDYATSDGTATAGSDYVTTVGALTFAPGQTSRTFNVPILNNSGIENTETVILTLSNSISATLDAPSTATLSIIGNTLYLPVMGRIFPACVTYAKTYNPGINIPDNNPAGIEVTINAPALSVTTQEVIVHLDTLYHDSVSDLDISLIGPTGTTVLLIGREGGSNNGFVDLHLADVYTTSVVGLPLPPNQAPITGNFRPEQLLTPFVGQNPTGTWRLRIVDAASADVGYLEGWSLTLCH